MMKLVLADEQPKVLFALNVLLASCEGILVVGEALNADELIKQLIDKNPDLIIVDWLLPGFDEIGSVSKLRKLSPNLYIIALSGRPELRQIALNEGADAFISKIDPPERLLMTITLWQKGIEDTTPKTT
jgi:DNA-binding NarL/FixJ family response regulator